MLSYELCKKLKEAGFPWNYCVDEERVVYLIGHNIQTKLKNARQLHYATNTSCVLKGYVLDFNKELFIVPTLSELIEACPELDGMTKQSDGRWFVGCNNTVDDGNGNRIECIRPTLEEAVTEIYLELHK